MNNTITELCELAIKHKTDKVGVFMHHYTPKYHELFAARRLEIEKVMEIGIGFTNSPGMQHVPDYQGGASLRMWKDYFPNALIIGADIRTDNFISEPRIQCFQCDQSSKESLENLARHIGEGFDIIIDDGSHRPDHYLLTARILLPLLKEDGTYIIEDVHHSFIEMIERRFTDHKVEIVRFNPENKFDLVDDNIAIIRK
jgi:hypothetical protein